MTSEKTAGGVLALTGIAAIGLMAIHPTSAGSDQLISGVHGSLMGVLVVQAAALIHLLGARGFRDLTAAFFYGVGAIAGLGAGLLNGFVFPSMRTFGRGEIGPDIYELIWWTNQNLAELGVIGVGLGYALWSVGLWKAGERLLGGFGLVAGLAPGLLLISGHLGMDLHGAITAYGLQALWVIAMGWRSWREAD